MTAPDDKDDRIARHAHVARQRTQLGLGGDVPRIGSEAREASPPESATELDGSILNRPLPTGVFVVGAAPDDASTRKASEPSPEACDAVDTELDGSLLNQPLDTGVHVLRPSDREHSDRGTPLLPQAARAHVASALPPKATDHKTLENKTVDVRDEEPPAWRTVPTQRNLKRADGAPADALVVPVGQPPRGFSKPVLAVAAALLAGVLVVAFMAVTRTPNGSGDGSIESPSAASTVTVTHAAATTQSPGPPVASVSATGDVSPTSVPAPTPVPTLRAPAPKATQPAGSGKPPKPKSSAPSSPSTATSKPVPEPRFPEAPFQ